MSYNAITLHLKDAIVSVLTKQFDISTIPPIPNINAIQAIINKRLCFFDYVSSFLFLINLIFSFACRNIFYIISIYFVVNAVNILTRN